MVVVFAILTAFFKSSYETFMFRTNSEIATVFACCSFSFSIGAAAVVLLVGGIVVVSKRK
ncbi:MAG: hypothetical protein FWH20_03705 [Oscillospiraceae bacterium]|nr:hypothetical protein [Oscillospiraceae bacterium]